MLFDRPWEKKAEKKPRLFERMKQALVATKENLVSRIESVLTARAEIDESLFEQLEETLLGADLGVRATTRVMNAVRDQYANKSIKTPEDLRASIRKELVAILEVKPKSEARPAGEREVWMIVGVNGTGKTTTVGKIASKLAQDGQKVLVCAADTFRPAAIEQLAIWAERSGAELIKSKIGSDPSAVLHDALEAANARGMDIVLVDTAGRLHTKSNLMQELEKMRRVSGRKVPGSPHEVLLVLDATTGQNALAQAREFLKSAGVTGLIVTKLDGTAKGGILFSVCQELGIPVRYIGVGEALEDLLEFMPDAFVDSLFAESRA